MTKEEQDILNLLAEVHNKFLSLTEEHPSEKSDWVYSLHILERIIMARETRRNNPDFFNYIVKK